MNILDYAMSVERQGEVYFSRLSECVRHEGASRIFAGLADDEVRCLNRYAAMKDRHPEIAASQSSALDRLPRPFLSLNQRFQCRYIDSDLEAFSYAIDLQTRVVAGYQQAAASEDDTRASRLLAEIAAVEAEELQLWRDTYDHINAPNEFLAWGEFSNLEEFHNFGRDEG